MKDKFKSDLFETAQELVQAKNNAVTANRDRRDRLKDVRNFSNGLAMMTEEEAKKLGRKEITNHLTTYGKLLNQVTMFSSMVNGVPNLIEVIVDTNDAEKDIVTGQRMSKIINETVINHEGVFASLWDQISGEIVMAGGLPALHSPSYGWLPTAALDMVFPPGTPLHARGATYAFNPIELSLPDLRKLLRVAQEDGSSYDRETIKALIDHLETQIQHQITTANGHGEDITQAIRGEDSYKLTSIPCWEYYEVRPYTDKGSKYESYVSKTIFCDPLQLPSVVEDKSMASRDGSPDARIVAHFEKAYEDSSAWVTFVAVDAEIGGHKKVESLRGVAELVYPSGTEMENLLNLILEGDKIRSRPKIRITGSANPDDVAKWNIEQDLYAPEGVEEMEFKTNNQHLQTPFGMLNSTAAMVAGGPMSNSSQGGELRQQALERQDSNLSIQTNRANTAYKALEHMINVIVWRVLTSDVKPGTPGYMDIMACRSRMEAENLDYKSLAEREYGRFKFLRVRARRVIGAGDRQMQIETSDWMMTNLVSVEPALRPTVLQQAFLLRTNDPDLAEVVVRPPKVILNQQRVIAENEFDTILRRAVVGIALSPQPDDIHHNHVETHFIDMQALIGKGEMMPWTQIDALGFAAITQHVGEHLQIIMGNPKTNFEGTRYLQTYQALIEAAKPLVKQAQESQQTNSGLTPKEQAELELAVARLELDARALGLKEQDLQDLQRIRAERSMLSKRSQFAREISDADRRELERVRIAQTSAQNQGNNNQA